MIIFGAEKNKRSESDLVSIMSQAQKSLVGFVRDI
jgi:hypothetical protein